MTLRSRLQDETGATLIAAVLIVIAMMSLGLAMLAATDGQSKATARERTREASFNLGEAALNAHALQLTRTWPANMGTPETSALPICTPSTTDVRCPQPDAIGNGYTSTDYGVACASSPSTPSWQTTVRDGTAGEQYWTQTMATRATYDANGDGVVWLHSQATTRCHTVAMVSLVTQQQIPITFPTNTVTANWFETTNKGKKTIIDTRGSAAQPSPVVLRCSGKAPADCMKYPSDKGQVQPPAVKSDSTVPAATLSDSQLASLQAQAQAAGRFYNTGSCPNTAAAMTAVNGAPVYYKGPCALNVTGNTPINSATTPGALIIENGSLSLGGNVNFYGLVYLVNKQNSSAALLTLGGTAAVIGSVAVDGLGGISAGASKQNLIFDPRAATLLKGSAGATLNKNTFRVVPTS
jgi:Tfp pilus assembly protein PilX